MNITGNAAVAGVLTNPHFGGGCLSGNLQKAGLDMKILSVVGKDYHSDERVVGYYNTGDHMKAWGKIGAFWGGLWGCVIRRRLLFVPVLAPLPIAGPLVSWIVGALEGAVVVGGVSALGADCSVLGVPERQCHQV